MKGKKRKRIPVASSNKNKMVFRPMLIEAKLAEAARNGCMEAQASLMSTFPL